METSTPIATLRSMAPPSTGVGGNNSYEITPLRRGRQSVTFQHLDLSNDDKERAERRRSIALRRSISNLPPAAASSGLNDSGIVLSEEDIMTHLQICTKLHADNKISVKNAWSLKIIDVLKQLVTRNHPDILKVAGNALEIAGKVYGLRVDDLHAEGLKLASSLSHIFSKRSREDEEDEENVDPNAPPEENQPKKKSLKKRRPLLSGDKKHTVNPDPKSWKGAIPKLESAAFSARTDTTVSAVGNLFTNKVRMDPAGYKFMFLNKEPAWQCTPGNDPSVKADTNKKFPVKVEPINNFMLCEPFRGFHLDQWDPEEENKELAQKSSLALDDVVCDENGIPIPELDGSIHDVFQERVDDDLNDDDPMEEEMAVPHFRQDIEAIVDFRPTEQGLQLERSEYSYNRLVSTCAGKIEQIWAGPSHWKLKCIRRSQPVFTGQDQSKDPDKIKKRAARKKHEAVLIDISNLPPPIDFSLYPKRPMKKKSHAVDESKITLPLKDPWCEEILENIEGLMTVPSMKPMKKQTTEVEYEVEEYRYDNPNDSRYVPRDVEDDDNGADLAEDHFDNDADNMVGIEEQGAAGILTGANLVDAPQLVPQSSIHYARRAKKMDMKKLKCAVWCTLTHTTEHDANAKVVPTAFSQMYKELPKHVNEKMAQELTSPLAFVALLHLCNEQYLRLEQEDMCDFKIFGPDKRT